MAENAILQVHFKVQKGQSGLSGTSSIFYKIFISIISIRVHAILAPRKNNQTMLAPFKQ